MCIDFETWRTKFYLCSNPRVENNSQLLAFSTVIQSLVGQPLALNSLSLSYNSINLISRHWSYPSYTLNTIFFCAHLWISYFFFCLILTCLFSWTFSIIISIIHVTYIQEFCFLLMLNFAAAIYGGIRWESLVQLQELQKSSCLQYWSLIQILSGDEQLICLSIQKWYMVIKLSI